MLSMAGISLSILYCDIDSPREVAVSWACDSSWSMRKDLVLSSLASQVPVKRIKNRTRIKITSCL
jgi:hypothetical protein